MAAAPDTPSGKLTRILVVEDDPGVREVTLEALWNCGWDAEGAVDGLEALRRLQHGVFDVVVTDLQMPRLDGFTLLREVRRMEVPLPVVVQTSLMNQTLEAQLRWAGAFRVLTKGGPLRDLVRSVEEAYAASKNDPARCA